MQHFLALVPEPQWHGWLRGCAFRFGRCCSPVICPFEPVCLVEVLCGMVRYGMISGCSPAAAYMASSVGVFMWSFVIGFYFSSLLQIRTDRELRGCGLSFTASSDIILVQLLCDECCSHSLALSRTGMPRPSTPHCWLECSAQYLP